MFESSDEITEAVENVYRLFDDLNRGDTLGHEIISECLGLLPHQGRWDHVMSRVERRLLGVQGIAFWPNWRGGYHLCTVNEQLNLPSEYSTRAVRRIRKGGKCVTSILKKNLSLHQRRRLAFATDRILLSERALKRDVVILDKQAKPTPTLPRRQSVQQELG